MSQLSDLQTLQNRPGKTTLKVLIDTPTSEAHTNLNWFYVSDRLFYDTYIIVFKCLDGLATKILCNNFSFPCHLHNTRHYKQLQDGKM